MGGGVGGCGCLNGLKDETSKRNDDVCVLFERHLLAGCDHVTLCSPSSSVALSLPPFRADRQTWRYSLTERKRSV